MKKEYLKLISFAQTSYRKCECCSRVRDIYFRLNVSDADTGTMLVGSFELCKECGANFGDILNTKINTERTVTDFNFGN